MNHRKKGTAAKAVAAPAKKRIFLVDDHPLFVRGARHYLESEPDLEVCGDASSSPRALAGLRAAGADLVIVDIALQGTNGLELIKHVRAEHPQLAILVLSVHDERQYAPRALRAGASGYVMKKEAAEALLPAVRKVLAGQLALSPALGKQLIAEAARGKSRSLLDALSDRELEVLQLIGEGRSTVEIADLLNVSVKTVESHRLHVREKLQLKDSADLVRFASEWTTQSMAGGLE